MRNPRNSTNALCLLWLFALSIASAKDIDPQVVASYFESWARERMAETHTPGMTIVAAQNNELLFSKQWGYSFLDSEGNGVTRMTSGTGLRVGSISKVFVGLAAVQLQQLRLLDMERDARNLVPHEYSRHFRDSYTFGDLLTHTAGFNEILTGMTTETVTDLYDLERYFDEHLLPPLAPVGDRTVYSNQGITMAALAMETLTGQSFAEYAQNTIFNPIGMTSTTYIPNQEARNKLATGYAYVLGNYRAIPLRHWLYYPASSLVTNAADIEKLLLALIDEEQTEFMRAKGRQEFQTQQHSAAPGMPGVCYVLWEHEAYGQRVLWHSGHMPGHRTGLFWLPEHDLALFLNYNLDTYYVLQFLEDFLARFFAGEATASAGLPINAGAIQQGTYRKNWYPRNTFGKAAVLGGFKGKEVSVKIDGDELLVGDKRYRHLGSNRFQEIGGGGSPLQYVPSRGKGRPTYITHGGMRNFEYVPFFHTKLFSWGIMGAAALGIVITLFCNMAILRHYAGDDARAFLYKPRRRAARCGLLGTLSLILFAVLMFGYVFTGAFIIIQDAPLHFRLTLWLPKIAVVFYVLMLAFLGQSLSRNPLRGIEKFLFPTLIISASILTYYLHYWNILGPRL